MYLLFYGLLYPLSLLPMQILYTLAYPIYITLTYIIKYRKRITIENLTFSFPNKTHAEILTLYKLYNRHLSHIIVEMLKMLTISKKNLDKRYYCKNPEIVNSYFEQKKSIILLSAHYNNWEWMILQLDSMFKHHGVGVGKANSNKKFEYLINKARTRYGTEVVFADHVRELFEKNNTEQTPAAYMMLSDQSPNNLKKSYITNFLNQESCMIFGGEYFAKKYDLPVFYYQVVQDKPGYYHIELELITKNPNTTQHGEITEKYSQLLEKTIRKKPEFWLWSHRRWKNRNQKL